MASVSLAELRQKAKLPAKQAGGSTVKDFLEANKGAMAAVLPRHVSPDRMLRLALTAVRGVPRLMECTTESLMGAVMQCAQLGLEPNTPLGHAYMIPFRNRREGRTDVQVIVGYRGMIELARRSGQIISISAHAVREHDEFDFVFGLEERLMHRPASDDAGEIVAFYAVAKLKGGGHQFEVMWRNQVDKIMRSTQKRGEEGPWRDHYEEMGRKTAVRRLFKYLPVSIELATATAMDEMAEDGRNQHLDHVLQGEWTVVEGEDEDDGPGDQEWPQPFADPETGEQGWVDSAGEYFDPERHGWSREGRPSVTSDGRFRARRGTRAEESPPDPSTELEQSEYDPFGEIE